MYDWLVGWLDGLLVGWLVGWLLRWLFKIPAESCTEPVFLTQASEVSQHCVPTAVINCSLQLLVG